MNLYSVRRLRSLIGKVLRRSAVGFFALQAVVAGILVALDTVTKRTRSKRARFPHPGVFESTVGESATTLYTYGEDLYADMLAEIQKAARSILFETYIWKDDAVGTRFKDALNAAADRGVDVYVIFDSFANLVIPRSFYRFHPDVRVLRFPVLRPSILFTNIRGTGLDHRKVLVVDDEVGFVGGYNISSLYATQWRDTHLRMTGPAVWDVGASFRTIWNRYAKRQPALQPSTTGSWDSAIRVINNIPSSLVFPIRGVYLDAINRATKHVFITTAYFIPDRQILDALLSAAQRGVNVRVIVPEDSNHVLADWLSRGFYTSLLRAGVTLLLYQNAMVHAKTATIDGQWSIVGTANIDRLSLTGNYEIDIEIYDADVAGNLEKIFEIDSSNSRALTMTEWERRHVAARFSEAILGPLRPLL